MELLKELPAWELIISCILVIILIIGVILAFSASDKKSTSSKISAYFIIIGCLGIVVLAGISLIQAFRKP